MLASAVHSRGTAGNKKNAGLSQLRSVRRRHGGAAAPGMRARCGMQVTRGGGEAAACVVWL
eukprot:9793762-Prorocentrum_lima.AAC.1